MTGEAADTDGALFYAIGALAAVNHFLIVRRERNATVQQHLIRSLTN